MNDKQDLTTGTISKKLIAYALPLLAANLLQSFYSLMDMLVVGRIVGETGLAAISNASMLSFIINSVVAFREKPKSFSHKLQKSTTFCKLAKNKRAFERYFISYQTPFYLFIIMAHPVCIPVYLKYHNSMPYKFGQDDSG